MDIACEGFQVRTAVKENQEQTLAHFGRKLCGNQSVDGKTRFGYAQSDTKMNI